jgi:hypothetical protein
LLFDKWGCIQNQIYNNLIKTVKNYQIPLRGVEGKITGIEIDNYQKQLSINKTIQSQKLLRYKSAEEELIWLITEALLEKNKQDRINR